MDKRAPNSPFESRLLEKEYLTPKIMLARIEMPQRFSFLPGQYVMLTLHLERDEYVQKPISIASIPAAENLELLIKVVPDKAVSDFFVDALPGTSLQFSEARGNFVIENPRGPLHFIAAGVGAAPVRAMYKDLLTRNYAHPIRLSLLREPASWGVFDEELAQSFRACKNFSYSLIHASPELATAQWAWRHLGLGEPRHGERIYISGSKEFVSQLTQALQARGFTADQIVSENA